MGRPDHGVIACRGLLRVGLSRPDSGRPPTHEARGPRHRRRPPVLSPPLPGMPDCVAFWSSSRFFTTSAFGVVLVPWPEQPARPRRAGSMAAPRIGVIDVRTCLCTLVAPSATSPSTGHSSPAEYRPTPPAPDRTGRSRAPRISAQGRGPIPVRRTPGSSAYSGRDRPAPVRRPAHAEGTKTERNVSERVYVDLRGMTAFHRCGTTLFDRSHSSSNGTPCQALF